MQSKHIHRCKNLEKIRPSSIIDIIHSGEQIVVNMKTIK